MAQSQIDSTVSEEFSKRKIRQMIAAVPAILMVILLIAAEKAGPEGLAGIPIFVLGPVAIAIILRWWRSRWSIGAARVARNIWENGSAPASAPSVASSFKPRSIPLRSFHRFRSSRALRNGGPFCLGYREGHLSNQI